MTRPRCLAMGLIAAAAIWTVSGCANELTKYFDRGPFVRLDLGTIGTSANFRCDAGCGSFTGADVRFHNAANFKDGGIAIGLTGGYRLYRYFALRAHAGGAEQIENEDQGITNHLAEICDSTAEYHVATRFDLPIIPTLTLYGTYGVGRKYVSFSNNESDFRYHTSGIFRPWSIGADYYIDRLSVGMEILPATGGPFASGQIIANVQFHW
jgi:hypothetical protein